MEEHRAELLRGAAEFGGDFVPVYSDIKSFAEAQSALDYLVAAVGIFPPAKEASKLLHGIEAALKKGDLEEASKLINKASNEIETVTRPSHRQSELDVGKDLGSGAREQVSYKDGHEVSYGTTGSTRPDWCVGTTCSVEVKNYNIATNQNGLINNVSKQAIERQKHLPGGMEQTVIIDIRGQKVTAQQQADITKAIIEKSNGVLSPSSIRFKVK